MKLTFAFIAALSQIFLSGEIYCSIEFSVSEESGNLSVEDSANFYQFLSLARNSTDGKSELFFADKALAIAEKFDFKQGKAQALIEKGQAYRQLGDLDLSLKYTFDALSIYEELTHLRGVAVAFNTIGTSYLLQENYSLAIKYLQKSLSINKENLKNPINKTIAGDLNNIGEIYRLWHKLDTALLYFRESLFIYSELNYDLGIAYSLGNIGLVHAELSQNDSAEYYILQATETLEELGDRYPIAVYNTYMADIYKDKGDWDAALNYAHHSLQIAEEEGLKEQIRDASLKLSELYRDREEFEKAYRYQNQYITYRDSINNEEVIRKMADLRTEYEVSRKQIEVDLLEQKNKTQSVLNQGLAIIIFLMFVLGLLIYQNSKKRKEVNELLSEQKEEIATQRDQLEELVSMKDRFFGIISHDLRSPVNSLQGITQLLRHYVTVKQTDQIEEFVSLADQSINNLSSLLDNLLSWALSQQGSLPYRPEKFRYYYVAEEVRRIFSNVAVSKKIDFTTSVPKDVELYADRDSVFALTRNLVNNAIKFTRESGEVRLFARMTDDYTEIIVEDTGVGIPEETLKKLFEFDKKKSTKGTAGEKGSGLGLALCKDIVELNHGKIEVQSQEGQGTKFVICLPSNTPVESSKKELI